MQDLDSTLDIETHGNSWQAVGPCTYLVRIGTTHAVGRFVSTELADLGRGTKVICRSHRGLESGTILGLSRLSPDDVARLADGKLLRRMTSEDGLLWSQMLVLGRRAAEECSRWLASNGLDATLLEVEPLMDGRTLYFHFLNDVEPEVQQHLDKLVEVYQQSISESQFAKLLAHGCGPGCGTENANQTCGTSSGCAVCQIASACSKSTDSRV